MNIPKYSKLFIQIVLETSVRESDCPGNVSYPSRRCLPRRWRTGWTYLLVVSSTQFSRAATSHALAPSSLQRHEDVPRLMTALVSCPPAANSSIRMLEFSVLFNDKTKFIHVTNLTVFDAIHRHATRRLTRSSTMHRYTAAALAAVAAATAQQHAAGYF